MVKPRKKEASDSPRTTRRSLRVIPWALLNLDSRACVGQLLFDRLSFFLRNAFFHCLRRSFTEIFRFSQPERRNLAHALDHVDLVAAHSRQNDVNPRLLSPRRCRFAT